MHNAITRLHDQATRLWRYDFFSVMRQIECTYHLAPRLGTAQRLSEDPLRLAQRVSLAFEPAMIAGWQVREGSVPRLEVNFFGLTGANGPMPLHFSEELLSRQVNHDDYILAHFLDLFHHRVLTLLYRSWAMARPIVSADRPGDDRFADYVSVFSTEKLKALPGGERYYANQFVDQRRSADGLLTVVRDLVRAPVSIRPLHGRRVALGEGERVRLGYRRESSQLGGAAVLGQRIWNIQHSFSLIVGPLSWDEFQRLMPHGDRFQALYQVVQSYVGITFQWDLDLYLDRAQVPRIQLGSRLGLGQATWLSVPPASSQKPHWRLQPARFRGD